MNNFRNNDAINTLRSVINNKIGKYSYNLARYQNDPTIDLRGNSGLSSYVSRFGFGDLMNMDRDMNTRGLVPATNVIKSVVDAVYSKIMNNKSRPYFTPVDGQPKTRQVVNQVQKYFDLTFDHINAHQIIADAFKMACVFDIGYVFIDPFTYDIKVLPTWCVATLNAEAVAGNLTKMLVSYPNLPNTALNKYGINVDANYVNFEMYVDIVEHEATIIINNEVKKTVNFKPDELPLVMIYFNKPVYGNRTVSIVDELDGIQNIVDEINDKISSAAELTPANMTFVYSNDSNLKAANIDNREGSIYVLDTPPTGGVPIQQITPAPFDLSWTNMLEYYEDQAYKMVGISQLSAQSRKPSGLNSGTALQSMEDIESDRFEGPTSSYINSYVDLANKIINILPEDQEILPPTINNSSYTWKDIVEQKELFKVQTSAQSSLSKDPAEKLKQVLQLSEIGLIDASKVGTLLDMPDLQDAFRGASAVHEATQKVIENCMKTGDITIPNYINYVQLSKEIATTQNQLYACLCDDEKKNLPVLNSLSNLKALDDHLNEILETDGYITLEDTETPGEPVATEDGYSANPQLASTQAISGADAVANQMADSANGLKTVEDQGPEVNNTLIQQRMQ